jgi:hypothetical protein
VVKEENSNYNSNSESSVLSIFRETHGGVSTLVTHNVHTTVEQHNYAYDHYGGGGENSKWENMKGDSQRENGKWESSKWENIRGDNSQRDNMKVENAKWENPKEVRELKEESAK